MGVRRRDKRRWAGPPRVRPLSARCGPPGDVAADVRHGLMQVVREATSTAVLHGKATSVVIRVDIAAGMVPVVVADHGKGFDVGAALPAASACAA